jgi:hypothetical protein
MLAAKHFLSAAPSQLTVLPDQTGMRLLTNATVVACSVLGLACLAGGARAHGDDDGVDIIARRPSGRLHAIEVRSGRDAWTGVEFGRAAQTLLLLTAAGELRQVRLDEGVHVSDSTRAFEPSRAGDMAAALRKEFGARFDVVRTTHYLVCSDTDPAFTREVADLAEELYAAFLSYFGARGIGISKPQFPLVFVVFDDESAFRTYTAETPGLQLTQISGYYSAETNRVAFFRASGRRSGDSRWQNVTTVIHEATHQLAFNTGCHRRLADSPLWLVEGLAMYFEAPHGQGGRWEWNEAGSMNQPRLTRFAAFRTGGRPADSLRSLIASDNRFRSDGAANNAYAESWALVYFLIHTRPAQFNAYLRTISAKPPLRQDSPEQRLDDFRLAFGRDLRLLDASFTRYVDGLTNQK